MGKQVCGACLVITGMCIRRQVTRQRRPVFCETCLANFLYLQQTNVKSQLFVCTINSSEFMKPISLISNSYDSVLLRPSHTAAITKTITITTQREHILLVELLHAEYAHAHSTNRMCFSLRHYRYCSRYRCSRTGPLCR